MTGPVPAACARVEEDLSALLDGELPAERDAEVRGHTQSCDRCRARLAALARVDVLLAASPVRETSASLHASLRARIAAEEQREVPPRPAHPERARRPGRSEAPSSRSRRARPLVAALLAAAAVALYFAVGRPRTPLAPAPEPRVAQAPEPVAPPLPASPAPERAVETVAPEGAPVAIAEQPAPAPPPSAPAQDPDFDALPAEEIAVGLELDTAADLEVIANLELLEALVALEEGQG